LPDLSVEAAPQQPVAERRQRSTTRLLWPASVFYTLFFVIPLIILLLFSVWTQRDFVMQPGFTLANYIEALGESRYHPVFVRTILIGLASAVVTVPIAYTLAYLMRFVFSRTGRIWLDVILVSMFCGYLVRIYAWRTILGREGIINSALEQVGLIQEPLTFLLYSNWAIIITMVGLLLPLSVLPIYSAMSNVSSEHLETARDLGSRGLTLHRTILLPMVLPGVSTAFAIAFILAAGDFVVPSMVGGTQGTMVGNLIANQFRGVSPNWPLGAALAFSIMAIVIGIQLVLMRLLRWVTRW